MGGNLDFAPEEIENIKKKFLKKKRAFIEKFARDVLGLELNIKRGEKSKVAEELFEKYKNEILEFYLVYLPEMGGRNISINRARHALSKIKHFSEFLSEIEAIQSKEEVLLFLYRHANKEDIPKYLNLIYFEAYIEKSRDKSRYLLSKPFSSIDLENLDKHILKFVNEWNSQNVHRAKIDYWIRESTLNILITMEYGARFYREFSFRKKIQIYQLLGKELPSPLIPRNKEDLKEEPFWVYPVGHYMLQLRPFDDENTELILGFDLNKKYPKDLLDMLLSVLFRDNISTSNLNPLVPKVISEFRKGVTEAILETTDPSEAIRSIETKINERKRVASEKVLKLNVPEESRQKIRELINSIRFGGFIFPGEPTSGTVKIDIIADIQELRRIAPNVEDFIGDLIQVYGDTAEPVILINNKPVNLASENPYARLTDEEKSALKLFFGDDNDEERV